MSKPLSKLASAFSIGHLYHDDAGFLPAWQWRKYLLFMEAARREYSTLLSARRDIYRHGRCRCAATENNYHHDMPR